MKNIFIILLLSFTLSVNAMNPADSLKQIPENFKGECYEFYNKVDKSNIWNNKNNEIYKTYKINIDKTKDLVITQYGFIIPYKYYSSSENIYNYKNNLNINNKYLLDYNKNTYKEINSKTQNEIILSFDKLLEKNNFNFIFNYSSNNYYPKYYISNDKINWNLVKKQNIESFSFKYIKIKFISKTKEQYLENIKIYELNFPKKSNTILVKSFYNDNIEIYSQFNCKNKDFNTKALSYDNFSINTNTKIINIKAEKNPKYNVYSKKDYDNDWIEDSLDNCKYTYNPNQSDINGDGIGDVCSDNDNDGVRGYYDNCIYVYNPKQTDININGVGDKCEFDKDKDGIFDQLDNCINISNPDQLDSDNDGIGNACDNSIYYNPTQLDKNNNGIGDITEEKEKQLKENDNDNDGIINYKDNCKNIANTDQLDSDKDGIGNACDNCLNYQNKDQLDFNKNGIGDICEDSDNDGIEGLIDNCINITNSDQKDSDNDGIGDMCEDNDNDNILANIDNCPYNYNPNQIDIDNDGIGDKCDKTDNRYIESNSNFFIGLLVFIVLIFGGGIFLMIRKLK